jgi:uroporphyrinogen decarboxylase
MNSKERVHAALRREPVDRVPIFMWFQPDTTRRLAEALEIPPGRVGEAMGNDVRQAWVSNNHAMEGIVHEQEGEGHTDFWGIGWVKVGAFNQVTHFPLEHASEEEVLRYEHPYDCIDELMSAMAPVVAEADEYFIGCDVSPCLFEMIWRLRGLEQTLVDMAANPALANHMLESAAAFCLRLSEIACERFPLDWLWTGDDIASQRGMMMSPQYWREAIRPHLARIFDVGKARGLWVAYHCCGSLRPIIPDLIDIGLDVLNPIQANTPGMDPFELKREFGAHLSFMGGVDTQGLLPNGTAADVRRETARLIEGMTVDGGGYILAASHTVPPETPLENIFAMYEVAGLSREAIFDRAADIRASITNLALPDKGLKPLV